MVKTEVNVMLLRRIKAVRCI